MDPKELEKSVQVAMATSFIEQLPEETRNEILAASVERTINEMCTGYSMKMEIEAQLKEYANVYVLEYVQEPEVQLRLKADACKAVDTVFDAVLHLITAEVQRNMKSDYFDFVKTMEKDR